MEGWQPQVAGPVSTATAGSSILITGYGLDVCVCGLFGPLVGPGKRGRSRRIQTPLCRHPPRARTVLVSRDAFVGALFPTHGLGRMASCGTRRAWVGEADLPEYRFWCDGVPWADSSVLSIPRSYRQVRGRLLRQLVSPE